MLLCELYQEEKDSSFTHDGKEYNLNKILRATEDSEIDTKDVDDLKWLLDDELADKDRVARADLSVPILITRWKDKWVTVDGFHRLTKAVKQGKKTLKVKIVTQKMLKDAEQRDTK